jgi:ElaB/YqjD/DUF883 family membrane-anchored ribosome-binding protein
MMSNVSDRGGATTDPAKGPGGTGKGRNARERLKTEAKETFETTPSDGGSQAETEAKRRLRATLETIEARASEIRRWSQEGADAARDVVEDHPLTVAASAFGVGLLIGLLAARI